MRAITEFVGDRKAPSYHVGMKKALSPSELQAAGRILAAVRASDCSQEELAAEVGVSQGLIWQWANARVPVPANRAVALGRALHLDPREISPAYAEIVESAATLALAPDEAALLAKYRAADTAGKRSLQAVSDALAVYGDQRKVS